MAEYETEEEQVAAIKAWWKKNGGAITTGIFLGLTVVFGWKYWQQNEMSNASEASLQYEQALVALQAKDYDRVLDNTQSLLTNHSASNYAALTALLAAKSYVLQNKLDDAEKYLQWAVDHAMEDTAAIARVRLARVQIVQAKYQQAISTLNFKFSEQISADVEEAKGDAYRLLGKISEAKVAYQKALATVTNGRKKTDIEMKMDNLAV